MKIPKRLLSYTEKNLNKALIVLILACIVNFVSEIICIFNDSAISFSPFLAFAFTLSAISNVIGAKNGETFNVHIFRRMWLRDHDKESEYEEICLKYVAVMVPISVLWSITNFMLAVVGLLIA